MRVIVCLMVLAAVALTSAAPSTVQEITHADIREAILSLVRMVRDSGDKLERHEYREKQLGEQLKKALGGLDKRHRASDQAVEAVSGVVARLDERLRNIEAMIKQRDERERIQLQKSQNTLDQMHEKLTMWMEKSGSTSSDGGSAQGFQAVESALTKHMDSITLKLDHLEANALKDTNSGTEIENLRSATAKLASTDAKVRHSTIETERILSQYEARLGELSGRSPVATRDDQHDWHPIFLGALENHQKILQDLKQVTQGTANDLSKLTHKSDLWKAANSTYDLLQDIKNHLESGAQKGVAKLEEKLSEAHSALARGQEEVMKSVSDASVMTESFYGDVTKSYEQLLKEVHGLAKVEQVMIQTADNVMDTKRRVEYGVHQILLEVGDLVKLQSKELNATINRRFDNISGTILDNQTGALTNLSTKIETEISQVWRQIGIMYQQLTASAAVLDHLQQQTEIYVNGSLRTMDSMEGKVGQITGRMGEVDENLNYLLGRLSLVTQEFNMIKSGLSTALDNIRESFRSVQEQVKDVGPGPNRIPSNEIVSSSEGNELLD